MIALLKKTRTEKKVRKWNEFKPCMNTYKLVQTYLINKEIQFLTERGRLLDEWGRAHLTTPPWYATGDFYRKKLFQGQLTIKQSKTLTTRNWFKFATKVALPDRFMHHLFLCFPKFGKNFSYVHVNVKDALMEIWKSGNIFVFILK